MNDAIGRCFGCDCRYYMRVLKTVPTGPSLRPELWCLECLKEIQSFTDNLLAQEREDTQDHGKTSFGKGQGFEDLEQYLKDEGFDI